jgi:hypothetical protein
MKSSFVSPTLSRASELGVEAFDQTAPIELSPIHTDAEVETVIRAAYRQVLGNVYVMESDRLTVPESMLRNYEISVRDFVRAIALSDLYRSLFFENCPSFRAIELNFKHLLGRAPHSYAEMQIHSQILATQGFEAEINTYLDSDEYLRAFGDNIVPYYRGFKSLTGQSIAGFTHMFQLLRGSPSSDKDLTLNKNRSRLGESLLANQPSAVTYPTGISANVNQFLLQVLAPGIQTPSEDSAPEALQQQYNEQATEIQRLQAQLAGLQSLANVGSAQISKWQVYARPSQADPLSTPSAAIASEPTQTPALAEQVDAQAQAIAELQQKISLAQSTAAIGSARLNRWQRRAFVG